MPATIAAILIEPVTGTNGVIVPPEGYLPGVRALCDKYGILLIADEVMSGFGRTGKWFAVDHWNVVPDLMTMAKGLTSAYAPLGAVAMQPQIAAHFNDVAIPIRIDLYLAPDLPGCCDRQYRRHARGSPRGACRLHGTGAQAAS